MQVEQAPLAVLVLQAPLKGLITAAEGAVSMGSAGAVASTGAITAAESAGSTDSAVAAASTGGITGSA